MIFARQIGARGSPSMILEKDGAYQYIPLDYNHPEVVIGYIRDAL